MAHVVRRGWVMLFAALTAGCCAPDACRPARQGFAVLHPLTESLEAFLDANGRAPADLHELIPTGGLALPPGTVAEIDPDGRINLIRAGGREIVRVTYQTETGRPRISARETYVLSFGCDGPGRNICSWSTTTRAWSCSGYY